MVPITTFKKMALAFPEVVALPHFHLESFRVQKKIFATLDEKEKRVMVKLSLADQSVFSLIDSSVIYPVPGGWGTKGATYISLAKVNNSLLRDALTAAYCHIAPSRLSGSIKRG